MDLNFAWHTRDEKLLVVAYWWDQQQGKCCICHEPMKPYHRDHTNSPLRATVEHLIPRREGGPNTVGNIRLAHAMCNHALGALWMINEHRKERGKPPHSAEWAIRTARGNWKAKQEIEAMTPLQRARMHVDRAFEKVERKAKGVRWCAQNAISLPRGATLSPEYQERVSGQKTEHKKATRMSVFEVARWLSSQGIRGA